MRIDRLAADTDGDIAAIEADLDAIVALEADAFTNPWSRDTLVWELRHSDVTRLYVLRGDEGAVAAFCSCWVIFDELHLNTVAVAIAARRQGLATALLEHVISDAQSSGAVRATLEVRASNTPALGLYTRLGFHVSAKRPRYYSKPEEDALILWKEPLSAKASAG
jgi:ribosomal-protein-alanine N-acetyltransferase